MTRWKVFIHTNQTYYETSFDTYDDTGKIYLVFNETQHLIGNYHTINDDLLPTLEELLTDMVINDVHLDHVSNPQNPLPEILSLASDIFSHYCTTTANDTHPDDVNDLDILSTDITSHDYDCYINWLDGFSGLDVA